MSQLQKRLSPNLRLEWKLLNRDKASALEFLALCEKMIKVGEFLLAHDVARAGLKKFKKHKKLSQRAGHALSKAGSPVMATKILEELVSGGDRDVETHSLLASAYKDLWEYSSDLQSKRKYAELAIARYQEAYSTNSFDNLRMSQRQDLETQYYPCINIAFMYFMSGDIDTGRENAEKARQICLKLQEKGTSDYWIKVTEAEALLVLGSIEAAAETYTEAVSSGDAQPSQIASTRKQALQIAGMYEDEEILEKISFAFPKLGIVACSGHVIDSPGEARRFPAEAEPEVEQRIEETLESLGASCGYSSAACGTDIIFLEKMAERGGETHIFLPFAKEEFIETSVRRSGGNWVARFEQVLDHATSVHFVTREGYNGEDSLYSFCNDVMLGFTAMRGRGLDEDPKLLAFWDGQKGSVGGTGELVERWRGNFQEPIVICANEVLESVTEDKSPQVSSGETSPAFELSKPSVGKKIARTVKVMLFADVEGFTKVPEHLTPIFVDKFLGGISEGIKSLSVPPAFANTWGDSFFAVFDDLDSALNLAIILRDYFSKGDWSELGLKDGLEVRISMHAGPVYEEFDPILKSKNFFGKHVNQAARIEPIVLPGSVYVSEIMAALLAFGHDDFDFEYVGNLELAKNYGSHPIYILQRTGYKDNI